jgi:hypothetical protein
VRGRGTPAWVVRFGPWALAAAVLAALMAPMVLTSRSFGVDWAGHLWLVDAQANNVNDLGHPSYFVQSTLGAFYPWFAFYGGTLYSAVGTVAAALGHRVTPVYVASFAVAFAVALGGMTWLARQAGLRGWLAALPGLAYVTSAYYVTDVYARGAWPETVAISTLPLLVAGTLAIVRDPRLRVGPAAAVLGATAVIAGSHNITLVWGTVFLVGLAAVGLVAVGSERRRVARRLAVVAGLFAIGVGIDLWFLLIAARLHGQTTIGNDIHNQPRTPQLSAGEILSPFRFSFLGPQAPTFDLEIPTLLLLWSGVAFWLTRPRAVLLRRLAWGLGLLLVPLAILLLAQSTWAAVPHPLWVIQFPYRLEAYVALIAAGLVTLALLALRDATRARRVRLLVALGVLLAIETGQSLAQAWRTPSSVGTRASVLHPGPPKAPRWWELFSDAHEFSDTGATVVRPTIVAIPGATTTGGPPIVTYKGELAQTLSLPVDRRPVRGRYAFRFNAPQGDLLTNVIGSPRLVAVSGATPVGRTNDSRMIVRLPRAGATDLAFSPAHTRAVVAGWVASLASLAVALGLLIALALRGRSSRRT